MNRRIKFEVKLITILDGSCKTFNPPLVFYFGILKLEDGRERLMLELRVFG